MIDLKLCGNHSLQDLQRSTQSGANYIGIIFADSKRQVNPIECKQWLEKTKKLKHQKLVGVFVNPTLEEILTVLEHVPLDIVQFHGTETAEEIVEFKLLTNKTAWKVIHHDQDGLDQMRKFKGVADGYVVDSKVKGAWGGTGKTFDWKATPSYRKEAEVQGVPCLIAGGITPNNVDQLLAFEPLGIDISSGTETNGEKDLQKIELLVERLNSK
ncbi:phosphoribosylanthranilate isomerase [Bacillus sp. Marseille-P3661]|uniref:phosphoribosylanthranilate isomerase n=1 Tax=Bacillus sp. Marseille-P3661 TaxID=1936234 RepID=UPI000C828EB2|nr:phosphoribosylanthranilate isomerase [Bacillus sp. Marseille-P3661]